MEDIEKRLGIKASSYMDTVADFLNPRETSSNLELL